MIALIRLILAYSSPVLAGQIFAYDSTVSYTTRGEIDNLKLKFALESGLHQGHYLQIQSPFISENDKIDSAKLYESELKMNLGIYLGDLDVIDGEQQFNYFKAPTALAAYKWYIVVLVPETRNYESKVYSNPINFRTCSSYVQGRIYYDQNSAFGIISLQPIPANFQFSITQTYANQVLTIKVNSAVNGILFVEIDGDGEFRMINVCTSSAGSCYLTRDDKAKVVLPESKTTPTIVFHIQEPEAAGSNTVRVSNFQND